MSSDPLSPYAEIDISTTDFGNLLSNLSVQEVIARYYRGKFRMPRILLPVVNIESQTGKNGLRAAIYDSSFTNVVGVENNLTDNQSVGNEFGYVLGTGSYPFYFNGSNYDRATYPVTIANASAAGAASTQLLAAGGASKKYRIHGIAISAVATAAATDGVVSVNEVTSGTILLSMRVSATSAAVENLSMDFKGVPQPTANNAIQVTSIANTTTDATILATAAY